MQMGTIMCGLLYEAFPQKGENCLSSKLFPTDFNSINGAHLLRPENFSDCVHCTKMVTEEIIMVTSIENWTKLEIWALIRFLPAEGNHKTKNIYNEIVSGYDEECPKQKIMMPVVQHVQVRAARSRSEQWPFDFYPDRQKTPCRAGRFLMATDLRVIKTWPACNDHFSSSVYAFLWHLSHKCRKFLMNFCWSLHLHTEI